jgi:hypothetical protein
MKAIPDHDVANDAGEIVHHAASDAEAVSYFLRNGRRGDYLASTGESMSALAEDIFPDIDFKYDDAGCVVGLDGNYLEV